MSEIKTNRELAQEISARIGNAPIPFDSVYSICLEIYNELGGEPAEFDSVYSILLETLPLAESIAKKTSITEVDELPDAQDNNNIYRLSSDDKVYMSVRYPDTITNRLPDAQQIDKAYLYQDGDIYYYKGAWAVVCNDGELNGYGWYEFDGEFGYIKLTLDNAEAVSDNSVLYTIFGEDEQWNINLSGHTVTNLNFSLSDLESDFKTTISDNLSIPIPAVYNAPESAQIGNATLYDKENSELGVYTGEQISFINSDEQITTGYKWTDEVDSDYCFVTLKPASEIYFTKVDNVIYTDLSIYYVNIANPEDPILDTTEGFEDLYIPQLNAPDSEQIGKAYIDEDYYATHCLYTGNETTIQVEDEDVSVYEWSDGNSFVYSTKPAYQIYNTDKDSDDVHFYVWDGSYVEVTFDSEYLSVISTVKYTRAIENWEWKQIPTMDDIPQYHAGQNISIDASNNISAEGYVFNSGGKGDFALYYMDEDEGEMMLNTADGEYGAFAEGYATQATGDYGSHSEGCLAKAIGNSTHAEGEETSASGRASHAEGHNTTAQNKSEHAEGHYNISHKSNNTFGNAGNTQHTIGIGSDKNHRKNAFEVMQNGDAYVFGIGGYQGTDTKVQNASIMTVQDYVSARETYVDTNFAKVVSLTQQQYDALATKDAHTLYIITDAQ